MAVILSFMVIFLCHQFQHSPKHSDFIGVHRRCSTVADFIVGSMVDETD